MALDSQFNSERRLVRLEVSGGAPRVRDSLSWRLPMGIPQCNLVAADATGSYDLVITDSGADTVTMIQDRIDRMVARLNEFHPSEVPLQIAVTVAADLPIQRVANA